MAKQYSSMFDLCGPMKGCAATQGRHLFMEGDLKFKDNINKVINDRHMESHLGCIYMGIVHSIEDDVIEFLLFV